MSRAALPGSRGKEKDRSNTRDRSSQREPKVDPVFESIDGPTLQGGEFSADEENTEEELYQSIVREWNRARSSTNNDSQVKGKPGERVRERELVRPPTEERDENEEKPVKKTVSQQPQQQVFTTAFQLQLGILIVVVVLSILLSILAHYWLFTHLYHIDSKNKLSDVDIDKKVKDSLEPEVLKRAEETKSTKVEIEELLQSTQDKLDQERTDIYEQLKNYQDRIDNAVKDASNIKTLIPNAEEMNRLQVKINEMSIKYSEIMATETDDLKIGRLQESVEEGERKLAVIRKKFGELQKNIAKALDEYEKHKDRIKKIKEDLDVIQPNTFNKDHALLICLAVFPFILYWMYCKIMELRKLEHAQPSQLKTNDVKSNEVPGRKKMKTLVVSR